MVAKMSDRERRRRPIAREPVARPRIEIAVFYRLPRITRERQQEMYIVQGEEAQPENLVRDEKVADVGSAESGAGGAIAFRIEWSRIGAILGALDVQAPLAGAGGAI